MLTNCGAISMQNEFDDCKGDRTTQETNIKGDFF
jgi:hypothetical protein